MIFFFHVIKKKPTAQQWRTTYIEKCQSIIVYIVDIVILSIFYYEGMGFGSRLLFKQIVFIIHNKCCQISFLIKAAEMFNINLQELKTLLAYKGIENVVYDCFFSVSFLNLYEFN